MIRYEWRTLPRRYGTIAGILIIVSGWLSATLLFAFVTQDTFTTVALSYAYMILLALLRGIDLFHINPLAYIVQCDIWQALYNAQLATQGCIVSAVYFLLFTFVAYVVFPHRDIVRQT